MAKQAGRVLWYPTQAKTGLEWGTQPSFPVRQAGHPSPNSLTRVDLCDKFVIPRMTSRSLGTKRFRRVDARDPERGQDRGNESDQRE
jgi:hypothetical protein